MIRAGTCPLLLHRLTGTQSRPHNQAVANIRLLSPCASIASHRTRDTGTEAGTRISPGRRGMLRLLKMRTHMRISAGSSFGSSSSPVGADTGLIAASLLQLQNIPSPRREFSAMRLRIRCQRAEDSLRVSTQQLPFLRLQQQGPLSWVALPCGRSGTGAKVSGRSL